MVFSNKNIRNKIIILYVFLFFALTILIGFLSMPVYIADHNSDYSQPYIANQNYPGQTYSSALDTRERNLKNLRLTYRGFVFWFIFVSIFRLSQKPKHYIKKDSNPLSLFKKLKRILIMKQNTGKYKSTLYAINITINH